MNQQTEFEVLKLLLNAAKDIAVKYQNFEVAHQIRNVVDWVSIQSKGTAPLSETFAEIRKITNGGGWDQIDNPSEFLKEMRGEE